MKQIDPSKTSVFYQKEDLAPLRLANAIDFGIHKNEIGKLINTCQWLHEVVERMESDGDWWLINSPKELVNKYMIEVLGYKDSDFKRLEESGKDLMKKMQHYMDKKNAGI